MRPIALIALALLGGQALAQGTGGLVLMIVQPGGAPLPGATVTLSHETGNIKSYTTLADTNGVASFPVLRPGPGYVAEVTMPGFGGRRQAGLRVPIGETATVRIQLAHEIQEHVRVVAEERTIDLERASSKTRFSDAFVQDLPVQGRFYQNVLTLAPGVQDPDGDGNPTVHGSRSRDFRAEVSGVSNVDPLTGKFMSLVNSDSIEEIEVITGGAGVEFGRAQGGFARILQKQGTNEYEGTFSMLYRSSKLDGSGAAYTNNLSDPDFQEYHPAIQVSGPLVRDKLWLRLSHEVLDQETPINIVTGLEVQTTKQGIHSDQLTWQASPRNKLAFQYQSDPRKADNFGVDSTTPPESTLTVDTGTDTYSLVWTAPHSPRLLVESTLAWQDQTDKLFPTAPGTPNNCIDEGPLFMTHTLCTNLETQQTSGSHFRTMMAHSQRLTVKSQATLDGGSFWGARHRFKFGFTVENERFFQELNDRARAVYYVVDLVGSEGQENVPVPVVQATLSVPAESRSRATGTSWALYVEDRIKPLNNLVITLGARVDREEINSAGLSFFDPAAEGKAYLDAIAREEFPIDFLLRRAFTAYEDIDRFTADVARTTGLFESQVAGSLAPITLQGERWRKRTSENVALGNTNWSPFVSISWDPWNNGQTKFAVSARRYYDKTFLAIPLLEVFPTSTRLEFRGVFDEETGDAVVCDSCLHDAVNPAVNLQTVDDNLRTPYQDEFRLVYERELWTETLLHAEYIRRSYRDQFQNIDINHRTGDFGKCLLANLIEPAWIVESPGLSDLDDPSTWLRDPHTGERYPDTDSGIGDGVLDDCSGTFELRVGDPDRPLPRGDGITDLYIQNPGWQQLFVVGNFNSSNYEGFVLELIRRKYRGWEMQASYTWSQSEGNGEDFRQFFLGIDPTLLDSEFGYQSGDQRHVFKLTAATITPWGWRLGGTALWQSGLPYSVITQAPSFDYVPGPYNVGVFSPARSRWHYPTGTRNSQRNDNQWLFDLKATREMNLGGGVNMQLSAEVFNLLNDSTYQIYNPALETGRQVNGVNQARREFGRRWQLGVKFAF